MAISRKVIERIKAQLKRYQVVLADAKKRDINEGDTVAIIMDMLCDVFGYKKFRAEITTEVPVRGTFVDLVVKIGGEERFLVEAKAIGVSLKDAHVKQAIDYGANRGIEWVILTNGIAWRVYKVHFRQPIDKSLVFDLDLLQANVRDPEVLECFGKLSREVFTKSSMDDLFRRRQATSKFSLAAILVSPPVLVALRRELRRIFPGIKIKADFLRTVLENEVLKREVVESEEAKQASKFLKHATKAAAKKAAARAKARNAEADEPEATPAVSESEPAATTTPPTP